jgi:anti-sigma factor RsiW
MSGSSDRLAGEGRHRTTVGLIGAYLDEEVSPDVRREVESHLQQCDECRRELRIQLALKARLAAEEPADLPAAMLERLRSHMQALSSTGPERGAPGVRHQSGSATASRLRGIVSWSGWLVAASLAALWIWGPHRSPSQGMGMSMGPLTPVAVDSVPEPIATAALQDFRRVAASALPQGPHLAAVQAEVPFSVPALHSAHMRLIGSWTTEINGEPAAVLAYRCHDRLVVQYVVAEPVFFRPPRVRRAIASSGLYAAGDGKIHAVAWPGTDSGSFLVGEFTAAELAAMRL